AAPRLPGRPRGQEDHPRPPVGQAPADLPGVPFGTARVRMPGIAPVGEGDPQAGQAGRGDSKAREGLWLAGVRGPGSPGGAGPPRTVGKTRPAHAGVIPAGSASPGGSSTGAVAAGNGAPGAGPATRPGRWASQMDTTSRSAVALCLGTENVEPGTSCQCTGN